MRSSKNYASILSNKINAKLTDCTISGATLSNIHNEPQKAWMGFKTFPPQLDGLRSDTDIVFLTGGGNDLNYDNSIFKDVLRSKPLGWLWSCFIPAPGGDEMSAEDLAGKFGRLIDAIFVKAPKADIFLVEYFTIIADYTTPGKDISISKDRLDYHLGVMRKLNDAYALAAKGRSNVHVVKIHELSQDHALGSKEPWLEGFSFKMMLKARAPFHPNEQGMRAVAVELERVLRQGGFLDGARQIEKITNVGGDGRGDGEKVVGDRVQVDEGKATVALSEG